MAYIILLNLQVVRFFVRFMVECFKKVFMYRLAIGSIVVYRTTIIQNTLNNAANCIKLRVVKTWLI